ncbi:MAG: class I SAM-dependent methyltransferase [Betaproteobacteria bacterium]|nr:class I SAM-dependent methyltransferase [Betaproteobacteria bacterium]
MIQTQSLNDIPMRDRRMTPSAWVVAYSQQIPSGGRVLDLACGKGRHACWLAEQGFHVLAVDSDSEAICELDGFKNIEARCIDLEFGPWLLGHGCFDGIVVTNYLHRPVLDKLYAGLSPGGILIYETFMRGNELLGRPSRSEFLLEPNELHAWAMQHGLEIIAFEESKIQAPRRAVVQRLCARRRATDSAGWLESEAAGISLAAGSE